MAGVGNRTAEERRQMAGEGKAMPDGSFPIDATSELSAAIGLARTPAQRLHVMKRARAMGKADMIPDTWKSDGSINAALDWTRGTARWLLTGHR